MTKKDRILGILAIGAALSCLMLTNLQAGTADHTDAGAADAGWQVRISVDGKTWGSWPLAQEQDIEVDLESGSNCVRIRDGKVYMEDADCPDRLCMRQGFISDTAGIIVCLPHKLVVEITGGSEGIPEKGADVLAR